MTLSEHQIAALSPDASSLKAGRELSVAAKWQLRAESNRAIWGHCQGSGKLPYQTQIDLQNLAFKCSCPSRKFPCKHGLGLLLLYQKQPGIFTGEPEPDWVTGWLDKRQEKTEKKAEQNDKPVDAEAQAKRAAARIKKVTDGIDELQFWIKDLVHNGLITIPEQAFEFWKTPAKRMVDAQANGLATMVKNLASVNYYNDGWKYDLLSRLTRMYTLTESFKHIDDLNEEYATEVKTLIGFNQGREEILAQPGIHDDWLILSRTYTEEEQLTVEYNWLYGIKSDRFAVVLQFFAAAQIPELNLILGTTINAELVFYKGVKTYRALIKHQHNTGALLSAKYEASLGTAFQNFSEVISANPFIERVPVMVSNLSVTKVDERLYLTDVEGDSVLANCNAEIKLKLLAITGGLPCSIFMQLNEIDSLPLAIWFNEKFYTLSHAAQR